MVRLLGLLAVVFLLLGGPLSAAVDGWFAPPRYSRSTTGHAANRGAGSRNAAGSPKKPVFAAGVKVRPGFRLAAPIFAKLARAADPAPELCEADAPSFPVEIEDDSCNHSLAVTALSASLPFFVPRHANSNCRGIQPSLGHPHGLEEPPRT